MKRILIMNNDPGIKNAVELAAPGYDILMGGHDTPENELYNSEIVVGWGRVIAKICTNSNCLKWVQSWSAGVDGLPLDILKKRGIYLTNASGVHAFPISESIIAMMLAFARGLRTTIPNQLSKKWQFSDSAWEIHGQTVGILGVGAIGLETARILKAFGMKILGLRRNSELSAHISEYVDEVYKTDQLHDLLARCDFVVNILPNTTATKGIMDSKAFSVMKPNSCYISVGRGPTTNQEALIHALQNGIIAYAGLDVTDPEPLPALSPLWDMKNVIITPHTSGSTQHYTQRALDIFLENLRSYIKDGKPVRNLVDLDAGY